MAASSWSVTCRDKGYGTVAVTAAFCVEGWRTPVFASGWFERHDGARLRVHAKPFLVSFNQEARGYYGDLVVVPNGFALGEP